MRNGTEKIANPEGQETRTHIIGVAATYGITNSLSFSMTLPLLINRTIQRTPYLDKSQTRVGDLTTQAQYFKSARLFDRPLNLQLAIGATIPISEGLRNVETDQRNLTSGTINPVVSFIGAFSLRPGWNIVGHFGTRQILESDNSGMQAGDNYNLQLGITFAPVGSSFDLNSKIRFRHRGQDIINGVPFPSSGGNWWYLIAGGSKTVIGSGESAIKMWTEFELPVYQDVLGNQLTSAWSIRAGFNFTLSLFGHPEEEPGMQVFPPNTPRKSH